MNIELPINEPEEPVKEYSVRVSAMCYADVTVRCRESEIIDKIEWMLETNEIKEEDFSVVDMESIGINFYDEVI